jgi:DNA-binding NtrC family response regulator
MSSDVVPRAESTETVPVDSSPPLGAYIRVTAGRAYPERYRLTSGVCRVGAGTDADIVVDDHAVSRRHVELALVPEGVRAHDLNSRNGTFCGDQRIQTAILAPGTRLRLGSTELALDVDREALENFVTPAPAGYGVLLGEAPATRQLFAKLARLEGCLVSVLIEGESGTGKELVARAIHDHSRVRSGPFVAVNCGALDRQLAKSELFGHKKGAFTGASEHRVGVFEAAHGGTLFLDELGELPLDVQPMLLRVLETSSVVRLGENEPRPLKVRVLAATNRDLAAEVREQRFREDLYYRFAVIRLALPPLRERPQDIALLARHFARHEGLSELPAPFVRELCRQPFPGNVRELKNSVQAFAALGSSSLQLGPALGRQAEPLAALEQFVDPAVPYAEQKERLVEAFTRTYLRALLEHTSFNQSQAARLSGLERSYLGRLITKHGIEKK